MRRGIPFLRQLAPKRVPFFEPKNRSAATITSKILAAWAADLKHGVEALEAAAEHYKHGEIAEGRWCVHVAAMPVLRMIYAFYVRKHGLEDNKLHEADPSKWAAAPWPEKKQ